MSFHYADGWRNRPDEGEGTSWDRPMPSPSIPFCPSATEFLESSGFTPDEIKFLLSIDGVGLQKKFWCPMKGRLEYRMLKDHLRQTMVISFVPVSLHGSLPVDLDSFDGSKVEPNWSDKLSLPDWVDGCEAAYFVEFMQLIDEFNLVLFYSDVSEYQ